MNCQAVKVQLLWLCSHSPLLPGQGLNPGQDLPFRQVMPLHWLRFPLVIPWSFTLLLATLSPLDRLEEKGSNQEITLQMPGCSITNLWQGGCKSWRH